MLLLIHNIHAGINLNNFNILEQNYYLYNNFVDLSNVESNVDLNSKKRDMDIKNINDINTLYIINNIPFSFLNPSYSSLGL
jgi:hypothetical protein